MRTERVDGVFGDGSTLAVIQPRSSRATAPATDGVASWYTPGQVDGFGDRLLMFDNTETDSLELLRFYPSLSAIAGFEDALHERVRQVGRIPDHAFPLIVAVERLEGDGALALVSTHIPGKRLSVFFDRPGPRRGLNPSFVTGIITQIVQALTVLQSKGVGISHGALTPDRVVVTTGGRVCVVEHVLGSALCQLNLSAAQLWREFGLVTRPDASGALVFDARTDVFQLGVMALEMLIGRRLTPQDLKDRLPDLIEQWIVLTSRAGLAGDRLRMWLERALQMRDGGYATAADAYADLRDMPAESTASAFDSLMGDVEDLASRRPPQPARQLAAPEPTMPAAPSAAPPEEARPPAPAPPRAHETAPAVAPAPAPPTPVPPPVAPRSTARQGSLPAPKPGAQRRTTLRVPRVSPWVAAVLALVALVEAGVIAVLVLRQPAASEAVVVEASAPVDSGVPSPIPAGERAEAPPPDVVTASIGAGARNTVSTPPRDTLAEANTQRSGGVLLQTPVELKVLQGDRVLGSTADGAIIMRAGTHQLDLINTALGLRMRQFVTFRAGQITNLNVTLPTGQVSANAQPWANVSIDDRDYGETPLANLTVPIGEHEIVFRHPDLGERRRTIVVRADGPTRVSENLEK
jgi:hypothetical protein